MSKTPRKTTPYFCKCQHLLSIIAIFSLNFNKLQHFPSIIAAFVSQMLLNAPRCLQMLPDAARCSEKPPDAARCCQILPEAPTCSQMLPNAPKHLCMTLGTRATCIYIVIRTCLKEWPSEAINWIFCFRGLPDSIFFIIKNNLFENHL